MEVKPVDLIVETPKGSRIKYAFDEQLKMYRLKKILAKGLAYPYDFGYIPRTLGEDGDPLDVMFIAEFTTFPGCVISSRIIGCIQVMAGHTGKVVRNDRYLAVPVDSIEFADVNTLADLPAHLLVNVVSFLQAYTEAAGKIIRIEGYLESAEAYAQIDA